MLVLTDANGDLVVDPKALLNPAVGFSGSLVESGFLLEVTPPNGMAPEIDVPSVPNGDVDDWASLLKDEASNAAWEVSD
jgi:hypothetical protein